MKKPRFRYSGLGYVALRVTDLEASVRHYTENVGLEFVAGDADRAYLRCSDKPHDVVLERGPVAGLARVGFELEDSKNLDAAFEHIAGLGYDPVVTDPGSLKEQHAERGFRFHNPENGLEVDFYTGQERTPEPFAPSVTKIARLGHVVLNVKSYEAAHRFWVEELGFAISDHVPGRIAFLRCFPNPLHHTFALIQGEENGLNHINFMVTDIDDIGVAMNRMKKAGVPIVFGPGRHLPSTSIFLYFLDPDGMTNEFSFGMELIEEKGGREPRVLDPKPEVLDTWGSIPDPRFGKAGVIVAAHD